MHFDNWYRFQRHAEKNGYDSIHFIANMPTGPQPGRWLDAYMGLVKFDCLSGFVTVDALDEMNPVADITVIQKDA